MNFDLPEPVGTGRCHQAVWADSGRLYLAYATTDHDYYIKWSDDGGTTFSTPATIVDSGPEVVPCSSMVAGGPGELFIVMRRGRAEGDITVSRFDEASESVLYTTPVYHFANNEFPEQQMVASPTGAVVVLNGPVLYVSPDEGASFFPQYTGFPTLTRLQFTGDGSLHALTSDLDRETFEIDLRHTAATLVARPCE